MRQAIITKYLGPTNHRGARVHATCNAVSITVPWDHSKDIQENHLIAGQMLQEKLGWSKRNRLVGGSMPNNDGYCFVQVEKE